MDFSVRKREIPICLSQNLMQMKKNHYKMQLVIGNRLYFTLKNLEIKTMAGFLGGYFFEDIKNVLGCLLKGRFQLFRVYLGGYFRFFRLLPAAYRKRKEVRKLRKNITDREIFSRNIPVNRLISKGGIRKLDIPSLCINYLDISGYRVFN